MFTFLKEKIKGAIKSFTKKTEEEKIESKKTEPEIIKEEPEKETKEEKIGKEKEAKIEKKEIAGRKREPKKEQEKSEKIEEPAKKEPEQELGKGIFQKIKEKFTTTTITKEQFNELAEQIEIAMLENNVAYEVVEKIREDLEKNLVGKNVSRGKIEGTIIDTLRKSIKEVLTMNTYDFLEKTAGKKPFVICFVGINGSGKTTTIAKIAKKFEKEGKSVVLAGADTFRAAAIEQLQQHADALGIKMVKHDYGADPAAVAFDAISHAKQKNKDIVLIDTAGRLHSNTNLIDEMKKIKRVAKPDMTIFVGESITGNDCVEQAQQFNNAIGIDGIILTKADVDEKGGAPLSISYVTKKPILFIGTGQEYDDLKEFNAEEMVGKIV